MNMVEKTYRIFADAIRNAPPILAWGACLDEHGGKNISHFNRNCDNVSNPNYRRMNYKRKINPCTNWIQQITEGGRTPPAVASQLWEARYRTPSAKMQTPETRRGNRGLTVHFAAASDFPTWPRLSGLKFATRALAVNFGVWGNYEVETSHEFSKSPSCIYFQNQCRF